MINWFLNYIGTGALIMIQFPMAVLNAVLLYPLIHNSIYIGKGENFEVIFSLGLLGIFSAIAIWVLFSGLDLSSYNSI
jgi:hypothetical protein